MSDPGPFGFVSKLFRWSDADSTIKGQGGPLPPNKARTADPLDHDLYQGLADGWLHGTVGASLSSFFSEPRTRKDLYVLFEKMDMTDYAGGVLDLMSEDATEVDTETKRRIWVESKNEAIEAACNAMLDRLKAEEECPALSRDMAKMGDDFERLVYRSGVDGGVMRMLPTPPIQVTRKESKDGKLEGYLQMGKKFRNDNSEKSYPWDFVHFRMRGRDRRYPYGTSVLHNGMRPWKRMVILEEWMLGYQIAKHPDRNLIMLDVGTSSDVEAADVARRFRQKLRKHVAVDPSGANEHMKQRADPTSPGEDIILPVRPNSSTAVHRMPGSGNATDVVPLQFVLQQFYSAVRAPKDYFGIFDQQSGYQQMNPKASLTNQDIKYARKVKRIQQSVKAGYRYLCELDLMLKISPGDNRNPELKPADLSMLDFRREGNEFTVNMGAISFLDELERLDVAETRQQVAIALMELGRENPAVDIIAWTDYIFREVVKVPDSYLEKIIRADLSAQDIDAIKAGVVPGAPGSKTEAAQQRLAEVLGKIKRTDREALAHRTLKDSEKLLLSEAIATNPKIRECINAGRMIFGDAEKPLPYTGVLPENELIAKGFLKDSLTEKQVQEMMEEAAAEAGVDLENVGEDD